MFAEAGEGFSRYLARRLGAKSPVIEAVIEKQGKKDTMPFRSEAQRRLFYAKAKRGEISKATVEKWEKHTPKGKKLPERVTKKAQVAKNKGCEKIAALREGILERLERMSKR